MGGSGAIEILGLPEILEIQRVHLLVYPHVSGGEYYSLAFLNLKKEEKNNKVMPSIAQSHNVAARWEQEICRIHSHGDPSVVGSRESPVCGELLLGPMARRYTVYTTGIY